MNTLPKVFTAPENPTPSRKISLWRSIRKLIRKRQETAEIRREKSLAKMAELRFAAMLEQRDREIAGLRDDLAKRNAEIKQLHELDIPMLERKLEVSESYAEFLATLHEDELARVQARIATANMRITDHGRSAILMRGQDER